MESPVAGPVVPPPEGVDPGLAAYVREVERIRPLSLDEESALTRRSHGGDLRARERLVLAGLRLVPNLAVPYATAAGVSLLELIEQGNLGLLRAAETYVPSAVDPLFCVYAAERIREAIEAYLASGADRARLDH